MCASLQGSLPGGPQDLQATRDVRRTRAGPDGCRRVPGAGRTGWHRVGIPGGAQACGAAAAGVTACAQPQRRVHDEKRREQDRPTPWKTGENRNHNSIDLIHVNNIH